MNMNFSYDELRHIKYAVGNYRSINESLTDELNKKILTELNEYENRASKNTTKLGSPRKPA